MSAFDFFGLSCVASFALGLVIGFVVWGENYWQDKTIDCVQWAETIEECRNQIPSHSRIN